MGKIKNMLVEKQLKPESDVYPGLFTVERCENFHVHIRNLRLLFNREEFEYFCQTITSSYNQWVRSGKPDPVPGKSLPEYYFNGKIHPTHGERPNDFAIEEQDHTEVPWMPKAMVHLHYKSLRLDVSMNELWELCGFFEEAKENMIKNGYKLKKAAKKKRDENGK